MTQPIRMDDAVIVENEWGNVEEINATYVVIRLWDWRRLVVPLSYFLEKPFQNWTRESASLIGTAMLYVDYAAPVDRLDLDGTAVARAPLHAASDGTSCTDGGGALLSIGGNGRPTAAPLVLLVSPE